MLPTFEEQYKAHNDLGYAAINEEPELFRELLKGRRFNRSAGITSAGEIPLFVLLPKSQEVVAIDHSYRALTLAFLKAAMLDTLGPKVMRKLMVTDLPQSAAEYKAFTHAVENAAIHLPPELKEFFDKQVKTGYGGFRSIVGSGELVSTRKEWHFIGEDALKKAAANIGRLKFIHGDMTDLLKLGEFDCFYSSNAFEHTSRTKAKVVPDSMTPVIRKGGYSIGVGGTKSFKGWKLLRSISGFRSNWEHHLFQRVE